jgi:hypothetical protein
VQTGKHDKFHRLSRSILQNSNDAHFIGVVIHNVMVVLFIAINIYGYFPSLTFKSGPLHGKYCVTIPSCKILDEKTVFIADKIVKDSNFAKKNVWGKSGLDLGVAL